MLDDAWDDHERAEIIAYIPIDNESRMSYAMEKAEISEGCCFHYNNCQNPFRWEDLEADYYAVHLAVSQHNVMYMKERVAKHVLNPCPPCTCCIKGNYREDF